MIKAEQKRDPKFSAASWLLRPDDPARKRLEEVEFYIPDHYFESSIKQMKAAYQHLHDWITAKLAEHTMDPVLAHQQLKHNLTGLARKIKRGKFQKNNGPPSKKIKTAAEHCFSEDEYDGDEEELMDPNITKKLVDAYKVVW